MRTFPQVSKVLPIAVDRFNLKIGVSSNNHNINLDEAIKCDSIISKYWCSQIEPTTLAQNMHHKISGGREEKINP